MSLRLLTEPHDFSYGDTVTVYERTNRTFSYTGTISHIVKKKINEGDPASCYIDNIYVKFSTNVYNHLLKRGSKIYYNGHPQIIGDMIRDDKTNDIEHIFLQNFTQYKGQEIKLENINSMLIWRIAYEIVKYV